MMMEPGHIPVLLEEVVDVLQPRAGQVYLDATVGRGGHAAAIVPRLGPGGVLLGLDMDPSNVAFARRRLAPMAEQAGVRTVIEQTNFAQAEQVLRHHGVDGVDLLLADLGFASNQMDDPSRGLSYAGDAPLDMRLDPSGGGGGSSGGAGGGATAADLVNRLDQRELADLIYRYGEERLSRKIAARIVESRRNQPIQTTKDLAALIVRAYGSKAGQSRIHPATRTFQALRIAVNGELVALNQLLQTLPRLLKPGGRAALISFHSLEDRPIKQRFNALAGFERLTRKPIRPSEREQAANPRSRSAKLRAIRRIG